MHQLRRPLLKQLPLSCLLMLRLLLRQQRPELHHLMLLLLQPLLQLLQLP